MLFGFRFGGGGRLFGGLAASRLRFFDIFFFVSGALDAESLDDDADDDDDDESSSSSSLEDDVADDDDDDASAEAEALRARARFDGGFFFASPLTVAVVGGLLFWVALLAAAAAAAAKRSCGFRNGDGVRESVRSCRGRSGSTGSATAFVAVLASTTCSADRFSSASAARRDLDFFDELLTG